MSSEGYNTVLIAKVRAVKSDLIAGALRMKALVACLLIVLLTSASFAQVARPITSPRPSTPAGRFGGLAGGRPVPVIPGATWYPPSAGFARVQSDVAVSGDSAAQLYDSFDPPKDIDEACEPIDVDSGGFSLMGSYVNNRRTRPIGKADWGIFNPTSAKVSSREIWSLHSGIDELKVLARTQPTIQVRVVNLREMGDCIFVQNLNPLTDDHAMIIDTGYGLAGWHAIQQYLPKFVRVLLTHDHSDHTGNFARLCKLLLGDVLIANIGAGKIYSAQGNNKPLKSETLADFSTVTSVWHNDNYTVTFLENFSRLRNENSRSVITRIDCNGFSYILTADAETYAMESALLADAQKKFRLKCDVLKWPHHLWVPKDSRSVTALTKFLRAANPKLIVVSNYGKNQKAENIEAIRELVKNTLGPDVEVRWTGEDGTITILSANSAVTVLVQG